MTLWRISRHAGLEGTGLLASARWHTAGRRIVYLADSPASALVETLVHLELAPDLIPGDYRLLKIDAPDAVSREAAERDRFPTGWEFEARTTRTIGDAWLRGARTAMLKVPSALVPETENWLLNPAHADAREIRVVWEKAFPFDNRLFRFAK